jgi:hypothetical protein
LVGNLGAGHRRRPWLHLTFDLSPTPKTNRAVAIAIFFMFNSRAVQNVREQIQYDNSVRDYRQRTMVITMIAMRVVQASIDQIINMVAVGNSLMATARAMWMRLLMSGSAML